jgi:hypothetical protein
MATLCKTYPDEATARAAVETLRGAGVPDHAIRLLTAPALHDVRREPVGAFAGTLAPDAPVGTFGNVARLRRQGHGSYAGDPDRQRRGCFADAERDVVVTYEDQAAHSHVAGEHELARVLRSWHVVDDAVEHVIDELHHGHATVVVEISEISPREVSARLDEVAASAA